MVVVVRELVEEGPRLQDEGREHHLRQVHPRPHLFQEEPDEGLVLLLELLHLLPSLTQRNTGLRRRECVLGYNATLNTHATHTHSEYRACWQACLHHSSLCSYQENKPPWKYGKDENLLPSYKRLINIFL